MHAPRQQQFVRRFDSGQIIFDQGDASTEMYKIRSGRVQVRVIVGNTNTQKQVAVLCNQTYIVVYFAP